MRAGFALTKRLELDYIPWLICDRPRLTSAAFYFFTAFIVVDGLDYASIEFFELLNDKTTASSRQDFIRHLLRLGNASVA